jgi:hypothetical protein
MAACGGCRVVDRREYFVDQLRWRLRAADGDPDSSRYSIPVADLGLAVLAVGQMFLVSRGALGALHQILQAQMG